MDGQIAVIVVQLILAGVICAYLLRRIYVNARRILHPPDGSPPKRSNVILLRVLMVPLVLGVVGTVLAVVSLWL